MNLKIYTGCIFLIFSETQKGKINHSTVHSEVKLFVVDRYHIRYGRQTNRIEKKCENYIRTIIGLTH